MTESSASHLFSAGLPTDQQWISFTAIILTCCKPFGHQSVDLSPAMAYLGKRGNSTVYLVNMPVAFGPHIQASRLLNMFLWLLEHLQASCNQHQLTCKWIPISIWSQSKYHGGCVRNDSSHCHQKENSGLLASKCQMLVMYLVYNSCTVLYLQ